MTELVKVGTTDGAKEGSSKIPQVHDTLLRQIKQKIQLEGQAAEDTSTKVGMGKMMSLASGFEKMKIYIGWMFAAITGATLPTFFFFIGPVFDSFTKSPEELRSEIRELCLIMGCIAILIFFASFMQNFLLMTTAESVAATIKMKYLEAVLNQESAWFDQSTFFSASRIDKDVDLIKQGIGNKYGQILYAVFMCISGMAVAFYKGWSLAFAMLGIAPIMMIGMGIFAKQMEKGSIASTRAYAQSAGYAEQALAAIRIVVSFGQEELESKNYSRFLDNVRVAGFKQGFANAASMGFFFTTIYVCYAYAFTLGGVWVDKRFWNHAEDQAYKAGDCLAVFFGILIGLFSLGGAGPAMSAVTIAQAQAKTTFDIIDRTPTIQQDDPNAAMHKLEGDIEFKNVTFFYPSRPDTKVMHEFSHKFQLGKQTAIVGPSGSGKSTTVQLTERFYDPNDGQVLIDGKDLKSINLRNFRQQIGYVGQEPVLFNTTIKKNILMGKPDATDDEIIEALKKTNSWGFVNKNPDGINQEVGQGGGQLSGGQKQRIALARAFIKKPKVLIFDEATSALDKVNEAEVQKAIDSMRKELGGVTTLVIAHRLSTVKDSDEIIVMKKGKIVEKGDHNSLLRDYPEGIYSKLAKDAAKQDARDEEEKKNQAAEESKDVDAPPAGLHPDLLAIAQPKDQFGRKQSIRRESVAIKDTMDPVSRKKMEEAELKLKEYDDELAIAMDGILNPKKASKTFQTRMGIYSFPKGLIAVGVTLTSIFAIMAPFYGWFIAGAMNAIQESDYHGVAFDLLNSEPVVPDEVPTDEELAEAINAREALIDSLPEDAKEAYTKGENWEPEVLKDTSPWIIVMLVGAIVIGFTKGAAMICLNRVSENVICGMRRDLYENIIQKDIGWHDDKNNSSGVMTSTLASDVQLLKGVSSEGLSTQIEGGIALLAGLVMTGIFSWPMLLVGLAITPLILICGVIQQKADQENMMDMKQEKGSDDLELSVDEKKSKVLQSDAIQNYKTIASFGNDQILLGEFRDIVLRYAASRTKPTVLYALSMGLSVAINNGIFGVFYFVIGELTYKYPDYKYCDPGDMFIAIFTFMFGAFTAAQASAMGPDMGNAAKAALKIFTIIDTPSRIDVKRDSEGKKEVNAKVFRGEIEFKDVWFRYPARRDQWVFKGLNLKINQNDNIAIVGESGQGKSTFINLVMRFYDPEFGTVLIDGEDVKNLNVVQLRERLGLVMQEPLLFNYTLAENILYGKLQSSNEEIQKSAEIANAIEFITRDELSNAFSEDPKDLIMALTSEAYKDSVIAEVGQQEYDSMLEKLKNINTKLEQQGTFQAIDDLIDNRSEQMKGSVQLHHGFRTMAGTKGSKLSGGQKQRIAIARAVIRQPSILLLDEATSALDEESQRLVQEALYQIMGGRTSIVVAHRLTTVERCNRLAVIDGGKIVEEGSFTDLTSKSDGFFANLANGMRKAEEKEKKRMSVLAPQK